MRESPSSSTSVRPDDVYDAYLDAVLSGDRRRAFQVVDDALEAGSSLHTLYLDVLQRAQRETGRLWQEDRITVAEEHLATAIAHAVLAHFFDRYIAGRPRGEHTLVAACPEGELHTVGLRMVTDLLENEGWDALYLGASVPSRDLADMVRERRPDVVALSASIDPHVARVEETIRAIRDAAGDRLPLILVGGRVFDTDPERAYRIGADLVAADAAKAVGALQRRFP